MATNLKQSWQQKLKNENEYYKKSTMELRIENSFLKKEVELLSKHVNINSDIVEVCGRMSAAVGESLHSMSNFVDTIERMNNR